MQTSSVSPVLSWLKKIVLSAVLLISGFFLLVYFTTLQPNAIQAAQLSCDDQAPLYAKDTALKILSYNVQFFAGTDYVFYFDLPDNQGPDVAPSAHSIKTTMHQLARLIAEQDADMVLLQEVHDGAKATDQQDQLALLLEQIQLASDNQQNIYPCHASAFYWQAAFVPHAKIMGSVGLKLATLSRYKIENATRLQLPQVSRGWLVDQFHLKRAILSVELSSASNDEEQNPHWKIMNTHFSAFSQGTDTMRQQVSYVSKLLRQYDAKQQPWILAGDFNLLPPNTLEQLDQSQHYLYQNDQSLMPLWQFSDSIPSLAATQSEQAHNWYTHLPNDSIITQPDRSIDYIFYSRLLSSQEAKIHNQAKFYPLSDHFALEARFQQKNIEQTPEQTQR